MTSPVACLLTLALIFGATAPAAARVPDKTPRRLLEADVRRTIGAAPVRGSTPGVVVMRGDRTLLAIGESTPLAPASLLKLATTLVAMTKLGPDVQFATRLVAAAPPARGVLAGPLVMVGGGDPTLATESFRRKAYVGVPKPDDPHPIPVFTTKSPTVEDLAARLSAAGVQRVVGDLLVDGSLFDSVRTQRGWIASYLGNDPEVGYLDALTINEGFTDPEAHGIVRSPSLAAGQAMKAALAARGIAVTGTVKPGVAPRDARELASVQSPALSEIVFYTNRWSVNYDAEFLLKHLGARFGGAGSTPAGVSAVLSTLRELGIPTDGLAMEDGSGLSLLNRVTPRTIAAILRHVITKPGRAGDALRRSMPVAAEPGTLWKRFRGTPAAGNLRGKTGTIRRVRSLAGWVTPRDGVPLVYVLIFNDVARPSLLTNPLDFIGVMLTGYPQP